MTLTAALLLACGASPSTADIAPTADVVDPIPPAATDAPAEAAPAERPAPAEVIDGKLELKTEHGALVITPVYHGTARVEYGGKVLWLDPWSKADLEGAPPADVVLITDIHQDHKDVDALGRVYREGAVIVAPRAVADDLPGFTVDHVLGNGESVTLGDLTVTAVPMYNLSRGPEAGTLFHEKGRGNGYLLSYGGRTVYFAGDTACTPDMQALTGVDLAFLPMNLPYTMTPAEAAGCVDAFAPQVAVPYHYAGSELSEFAVSNPAVTVARVDFYPGGLPW